MRGISAVRLGAFATFAILIAAAFHPEPACAAPRDTPRLDGHADPVVDSMRVRSLSGATLTRLVPGDTVFVDTYVSDADGFGDVTRVDWELSHEGGVVGPPTSLGATFRWRRGQAQPWIHTGSGQSWQVVPALCWADTTTFALDARLVRLAILISPIARASSSGEWEIAATPWTGAEAVVGGIDMAEHIRIVSVSAAGVFEAGLIGARDLPLIEPANGRIHLEVMSNGPWRLLGRADRFRGVITSALGFDVLAVDSTLAWALHSTALAGVVDSSAALFADLQPPNASEAPNARDLTLVLRHPVGLIPQNYAGSLWLGAELLSGADTATANVPLLASVSLTPAAASSAVAEIDPGSVAAGATGQAFRAFVRADLQLGDTGVNRVTIGLPPGFSSPDVFQVRVNGFPVAYDDSSDADHAAVQFLLPLILTSVIEVQFYADAPDAAKPAAAFGVVVDDTRNTRGGTAADPGDASPAGIRDRLDVAIVAGPAAFVDVDPPLATLADTDTLRFSASATDAFGNPASETITWRTTGGIGWVDGAGLFSATTAGSGTVIAEAGAAADTALVTVTATAGGGIRLGATPTPGGALLPGGGAADLLHLRFANDAATPDTLRRLLISNAVTGAGSTLELDAAWSPIELRLAGGPALAVASFAGGLAVFDSLAIVLPAADSIELVVRGAASVRACDGDLMRVLVANGGSVTLAGAGTATAAWPIVTTPPLPVDGMSAAQIGFTALAASITVGTIRQPVASLDVPSNGYAADTLRRVNLVPVGDADPITDLPRLELWADDGSGDFDAGSDPLLGTLAWTGDRWERTGLQLAFAPTSRRLFVTADAAETARAGARLALALPTYPDVALGMSSGNSGPVDAAIVLAQDVVISIADRVTVIAEALGGGAVAPGRRDVPLLAAEFHNTYAGPRSLSRLRVQNVTAGPGSQGERDGELTRLDLRADANHNGALDDPATDPVLASAVLADGRATFDGLAWTLGPGTSGRLFVVAGVSLAGAADGDRLAIAVGSALDLEFSPASTMAASWPVVSPGPPTVDGMVAAQLAVPGAAGVTIGPGDGPVEAFDLLVPRNGYQSDVLTGVRFANAGSAASSDLAELRLWRDGGDGVFDAAAGDDRDLGPLARVGGEWLSPILAEALGAAGARLFVGATVAAAPADSVTLQIGVPVDGVTTVSGNHGPRDLAVENPGAILISTAALLGTFQTGIPASTVGQSVPLELRVRNRGAETVTAVAPVLAGFEGTGLLTVLGSPSPASADLAPGAETTFVWPARADGAGDVTGIAFAQGTGAVSGLPRRSLFSRSNRHPVFESAADIAMFAVQSMPFAVERGQTGVVPLSLTFEHPGSAAASDVRIDGIRLRLERQSGAGIVPASLLSRIAVVEGATTYLERTALEAAGATVDLDLARPVFVTPGNPVTVALQLDIADSTSVPDFRVVIVDSTVFTASDATSGAPVVTRLLGASFPVASGLARVLTGVRELQVDAAPETVRANRSQSAVRIGRLRMRNPSDPAAGTEVRVGSIRFALRDSTGAPRRDLDRLLTRLTARSAFGVHADRAVSPADSVGTTLALTAFLSVPPGATLDLDLEADLRADAPAGAFLTLAPDSSAIETRDAGTGEAIPVVLATTPLVLGSNVVEAAADTIAAAGIPAFPAAAGIGRPGLPAMTLVLRHPGGPGESRARVDSLTLELLDAARQRVAPGDYLARLVVARGGAVVGAVPDPSASPAPFGAALAGIVLAPGASETLTVVVDLDVAAPTGAIEVVIRDGGIHVSEVNAGGAVRAVPEPGADFPFSSGVLRLDTPARRLEAGLESRIPAALPADGSEVPFARLRLANTAPAGSGPIEVAGLRLAASEPGGTPLAIGAVAEGVRAFVTGTPWAANAALTADSVTASLGGAPLAIPAAGSVEIELRFVPRRGGSVPRFRLGLDRGDIGVVQPSSSVLSIAVEAEAGQTFPFWTEAAGIASDDLAASVGNYPNPFAAGREPTTFVFRLDQPSRVTLRILTLRGDVVRTLHEGAALPPGLRQGDQWDGRNGAGRLVANGVYVAELIVEPGSGAAQRILRKVAVLR